MRDLTGQILFWALFLPAMAFVMRYLAKARLQRPNDLPGGQLRHPWTTLALGLAGLLLFGGFALLVFVVGPKEFGDQRQQFGLILSFLGFAILFIPVVVEHQYCRHCVSEDGIQYQPLLRRGGFLKWSDVRRVRYSPVNKWFRLDGANGEVVRITVMLLGLQEFAEFALDRVPPASIEPPTLARLIATRDGNPPSIWQ